MHPFIDAATDAVARAIAGVQREADRAEQLRAAEHRAFMAEQREVLAGMVRKIEARLAEVRDGIDGKDGADGIDGADGKDGLPGKDGEPGPAGRDGAAGRDGLDGKDGADGQPGPQGEPGRDGADGKDGAPGRDGIDGKDGEPGKDGVAGAPGRDGAGGRDGEPGQTGPQGEPGRDGTDGKDGRDGTDGKDAYPGEARGLFDPAGTYRALDVVSFNGCEWRAKRNAPGELPGDGWMLSASRGKRGDRGERGLTGNDGASLVALYPNDDGTQIVLTKDNGEETVFDVERLVRTIRGA